MSRFKRFDGDRSTVEIHKLDVVKERCIRKKETLKEYINRLIYQDMLHSDEDLSIRYYKDDKQTP